MVLSRIDNSKSQIFNQYMYIYVLHNYILPISWSITLDPWLPILILPHSQLISIPTLHTQYPFPYYSIPIAILFYVHTKSTYYLLLIWLMYIYTLYEFIYFSCPSVPHTHSHSVFFKNIFDETLAAKYMQHNSPHSLARQTHTISRGTSMGLARNTEYIY